MKLPFAKHSSLGSDLLSNYLINILTAISGILFVPIYLRFLGAEAYGIIGLFASLQAIFAVFEGGLGTAFTKEISERIRNSEHESIKIGSLLKTLGTIYWFISFAVTSILLLLVPILCDHWINIVDLSVTEVKMSLTILCSSILFLMPSSFYTGGLIGLQKHIKMNLVKLVMILVKYGGSVLILYSSDDKLFYFFLWQLFCSLVQVLMFRMILRYEVKMLDREWEFKWSEFNKIKKYAAGVTGINLTALLISQTDRIVLSKILPLSELGIYSVAVSVAVLIYQLIQPINQIFFPKLTGLIGSKNQLQGKSVYKLSYQLTAMFVIPAFLILFVFRENVMGLVASDKTALIQGASVLGILAVANGFNAIMTQPYLLSLANGWVRFGLYQNIIMLIVLLPLNIFLSINYGAFGSATSWLVTNALMLIISSYIIHATLLPGEHMNWLKLGFGYVFLVNAILIFAFYKLYHLLELGKSRIIDFFVIFIIGVISILVNAYLLPEIRLQLKSWYNRDVQ